MAEYRGVRPPSKARSAIAASAGLMQELNQPALAQKLVRLEKELTRERFSVAVVGEFSRGKSTLINRLLGRPLLPVGNMPTTAMLTCIRSGNREAMVYVDEKGARSPAMPVQEESWRGLTANNFGGEDPQGTVFLGIRDPWMDALHLEILDTPGAGDLEDRRARRIGDALMESDGAIITVSALSPMSMSEQQFIQQRLIARKTPFLMLAITKLDEVPVAQRADMIRFVQKKLALWKLEISVFVAGKMEIPGGEFEEILGVDKIRSQLEHWIRDPNRRALTDRWILARVDSVLALAQDSLQEQCRLMSLDEEKRQEAIRQKREQLARVHDIWEELRQEMRTRSEKCIKAVLDKAEEYKQNMVQRLSFEVSHNSQPAAWWRQDFGYRLRVELAGAAAGLDSLANRMINEDLRWLNARLEKSFKTSVTAEHDALVDKEMFDGVPQETVELEDLDKQRSISRIATAALTIVGSLTLSSMGLGMLNILATSGVGTGASLITEKFFKGKLEEQRKAVAEAVAQQVPKTVDEAMMETRSRLRMVYSDIIQAASDRETAWMEAQNGAIDQAGQAQSSHADGLLPAQLERIRSLRQAMAGNRSE